MRKQFLPSIWYIVCGLATVVLNGILALAFYRHGELKKNHSFMILFNLSLTDGWTDVGFAIQGFKVCYYITAILSLLYDGAFLQRCLRHLFGVPEVMVRIECWAEMVPLSVGVWSSHSVALLLAVDRLLAVIRPLWYRNSYTTRMVLVQLLFVYCYVAAEILGVQLLGTNYDTIPSCGGPTATGRTVKKAHVWAKVSINLFFRSGTCFRLCEVTY